MAAGTKAAALAALVRVLWVGFPALQTVWQPALLALALVTMVVGNLLALVQADVKRMLAFSAVAHAGYLVVAVATVTPDGGMAALYYLGAYAAMSVGAFAVLVALGQTGDEPRDATTLDDLRGLARRHPGLAVALSVFLLSLTGLPPTAGFLGKWYIFRAAIDAGLAPFAAAIMIMSAVSAFYYLRPVLLMYMAEPADGAAPFEVSAAEAVSVAMLATIVGGALLATIPLASGAEAAGAPGVERVVSAPSGGSGLFFAAPSFSKDPPPATATP
jgi:NADH-quinone oxidoreductase subunit N